MLTQGIAAIAAQVQQLAGLMTQSAPVTPGPVDPDPAPASSPRLVAEPRVGEPERYGGDPDKLQPIHYKLLYPVSPLASHILH